MTKTAHTQIRTRMTIGSATMKEMKNVIKGKKQKTDAMQFVEIEIMNNEQIKVIHNDMIGNVSTIAMLEVNTENENDVKSFLFPIETIKKVKGIKKDSLYIIEIVNSETLIFNDNGINQTLHTLHIDNKIMPYATNNKNENIGSLDYVDIQKLKSAALSVATSAMRPILMNVEMKQGKAVSTDSHRLYRTELSNMNNENPVLINSIVIDKIIACEGKDKKFNATVCHDDYCTAIKTEKYEYVFRNAEGNYPDTSRLIPSDFKNTFTIKNIDQLENTVKAITRLTKGTRNNVMKLEIISNKEILLSGKSEDFSSIEQIIAIESAHVEQGYTMQFSSKYFLDSINQTDGNSLVVNIVDSMRPFILNSEQDRETISLVLPIRMT